MFSSRASIATAAAFVLAGPCANAADEPVEGRVVAVHDGDTITVESDGVRHSCRLLGIDAPELSYARLRGEMERLSKHAPRAARDELRAAEEVFRRWAKVMEGRAREARDALAETVSGKTVTLTYDTKSPRRDRYRRLLVYVGVGAVDVNAKIIKRGFAVAETRFSCDRLDEYVALWREAQARGDGPSSASDSGGDR